ncbi:MAG: ATP-binding protein [Bacillota bacterium]
MRLEVQMLKQENEVLAKENKKRQEDSVKYNLVLNHISEIFAICEMVNVLNAGVHIALHKEQTPDLLLDKKEIRQLILNLVQNGVEAMPDGGKLTIKTYTIKDVETVLSVHDEGKGIDPKTLKYIGTPFYTTKEKGTGLGLAICYSVANRHNARIDVETSPKGTTFYVRFQMG